MRTITTDVLISGCGPTGALAGNLLGQFGLRAVIVEREKNIFPLPRAVVIDDDVARIFQYAGLADRLLAIGQASKGYHFVDQDGEVMFGFKRSPYNLFGYPSSIMIHQPDAEAILREGLKRYPDVQLQLEHELLSLEQDDNGVAARVRDIASDETYVIQARYLLVCEGARSQTRKSLGFEMTDFEFDHQWIVIDSIAREPLGLPEHNIQHCNATRPTSYIYMGKNRYRWEVMLHPEETKEEMSQPHKVRELLSLWTDPSKLDIERTSVYVFHALNAKEWRRGNVFLLGDSAHQTPPFLGQGLCSGLRDAQNVCWKLRQVMKEGADPALLDTYQSERLPHVEQVIRMAVRFGHLIQAKNKDAADMRDFVFQTLNMMPGVREALRNIERSTLPMGAGLHEESQKATAGKQFIQPKVTSAEGKEQLLDYSLAKKFTLLGLHRNPAEAVSPETLSVIDQLDVQLVEVKSADDDSASAAPAYVTDSSRLIADWCEAQDAEFVLLRPDRYVYGVYKSHQLDDALAGLRRSLRRDAVNSAR